MAKSPEEKAAELAKANAAVNANLAAEAVASELGAEVEAPEAPEVEAPEVEAPAPAPAPAPVSDDTFYTVEIQRGPKFHAETGEKIKENFYVQKFTKSEFPGFVVNAPLIGLKYKVLSQPA